MRAQLVGGFFGGTVFAKVVHSADMGFVWIAVTGTLGCVLGGQFIGLLRGKTEVATGIDVIAVIGLSWMARCRVAWSKSSPG